MKTYYYLKVKHNCMFEQESCITCKGKGFTRGADVTKLFELGKFWDDVYEFVEVVEVKE